MKRSFLSSRRSSSPSDLFNGKQTRFSRKPLGTTRSLPPRLASRRYACVMQPFQSRSTLHSTGAATLIAQYCRTRTCIVKHIENLDRADAFLLARSSSNDGGGVSAAGGAERINEHRPNDRRHQVRACQHSGPGRLEREGLVRGNLAKAVQQLEQKPKRNSRGGAGGASRWWRSWD